MIVGACVTSLASVCVCCVVYGICGLTVCDAADAVQLQQCMCVIDWLTLQFVFVATLDCAGCRRWRNAESCD